MRFGLEAERHCEAGLLHESHIQKRNWHLDREGSNPEKKGSFKCGNGMWGLYKSQGVHQLASPALARLRITIEHRK